MGDTIAATKPWTEEADVVEPGAMPGRVVAEGAICCVLPERDEEEELDVELLEGGGGVECFPTVPPTAPPITPPTMRIAMTKAIIIPLRVRQNDWAGFLENVEVVGGNFSCEPFSTSVSIGGGGESGWVERGR